VNKIITGPFSARRRGDLEVLVGKFLVVMLMLLFTPFSARGQMLSIDPTRDLALQDTVQAFLDDKLTANQLEAELRSYIQQFEARPYKVRTMKIDWEKVPQERMFAFAKVSARITGPPTAAFFRGELTAAQTAVKIAPFFLIWPGYGMDPPGADSLSRQRTDELLEKIRTFAGVD
jgi:hypothetical protein